MSYQSLVHPRLHKSVFLFLSWFSQSQWSLNRFWVVFSSLGLLINDAFFSLIWASIAVLDRFSRCNSTREYGGRKISWVNTKQETAAKQRRVDLEEKCDVFSGRWVFDNISYPPYEESSCPYMSDQLACHKHGRPDLNYQYWRWQPHGCNLKRCSLTFNLVFILSISVRGELFLLSCIGYLSENPRLIS